MLFKSKSHFGSEMEHAARDYINDMGKDSASTLKKISDNFPYLEDIAIKEGSAYELAIYFLKETKGMDIPSNYINSITGLNPNIEEFQNLLSDELFILKHLEVDKDSYLDSLNGIHDKYNTNEVKNILKNYNQFFDAPDRISWLNYSLTDLYGYCDTDDLIDLLSVSVKSDVDTQSLKKLLGSIDNVDERKELVIKQVGYVNPKRSLIEPTESGFRISYDDYYSYEKSYGIFVPLIEHLKETVGGVQSNFDEANLNNVGRLINAKHVIKGPQRLIETVFTGNSIEISGLSRGEIEETLNGLQDLRVYYDSYKKGLRSIYSATNWFSPSTSDFSFGNINYTMDWQEASSGANKINVLFNGKVRKSLWDSLESIKDRNNTFFSKGVKTSLSSRRLDVTLDAENLSVLDDVGLLVKKYLVVDVDDIDSLCFINSSVSSDFSQEVNYTDFDFNGFSNSYKRGHRSFSKYFESTSQRSKEESIKIILNMKIDKENKEISKWLVNNHKDIVDKVSRS